MPKDSTPCQRGARPSHLADGVAGEGAIAAARVCGEHPTASPAAMRRIPLRQGPGGAQRLTHARCSVCLYTLVGPILPIPRMWGASWVPAAAKLQAFSCDVAAHTPPEKPARHNLGHIKREMQQAGVVGCAARKRPAGGRTVGQRWQPDSGRGGRRREHRRRHCQPCQEAAHVR